MRITYIFLVLLGLIFIIDENLSQAAQIDIDYLEEFVNIRFVGNIEKGDAEEFKKIVKDLKQKKRSVNMLMLASNGGDAIEAMRIGTIVRESFIPTCAPFTLDSGETCNDYALELKDSNCDCASACFFIWVAGIYRIGNVLGIHQPYFSEGYLEELSSSEADKEYILMYETVSSYLKTMDVPEHIVDKLFNTNPDEITYLDLDTVKSMETVSIFEQLVGTICSRLSAEQEMDYWQLLTRKGEGKSNLTKSEKFYLNYLTERKNDFNRCFREKIKEAQLKEKN